jgi:DNA modification methylase
MAKDPAPKPSRTKTPPLVLKTLDDLQADPDNPRSISKAAIEGLGYSLGEFGDLSGITYNTKTGQIVCGHQRLDGLRQKFGPMAIQRNADGTAFVQAPNGETYRIREVAWPRAKQRAANIAANNPALQGRFTDAIHPQLQEILAENAERFRALRFGELQDREEPKPGKTPADALPELPTKPRTKPGDLYILGRHRILCGDSTQDKDVERLMAGQRAHMVFTDPPYGVGYKTISDKIYKPIRGDEKKADDLVAKLLRPAFRLAAKHSLPTAAFYIWHASSTREDFTFALKAEGIVETQYLIWVKNNFIMGHADYHWAHEPCFYCHKDGESAPFHGDRKQQTVWTASLQDGKSDVAAALASGLLLLDGQGAQLYLQSKAPKGKKLRTIRITPGQKIELLQDSAATDTWTVARDTAADHPTQKPVELATRALINSSLPDQIVLDLFGGTGCTLIAAEQLNRQARIMERDPGYCDLIVDRWQAFTGETAEKAPKNG